MKIYSIILLVCFVGVISCLPDVVVEWTEDNNFPSPLNILVGQKVVWKAVNSDKHEILLVEDNVHEPMINNVASHVFKKAGWFSYSCTIHPGKRFYVKVAESENQSARDLALKEIEDQQRAKENLKAYEKREVLYRLQQQQAEQELKTGVKAPAGPFGAIPADIAATNQAPATNNAVETPATPSNPSAASSEQPAEQSGEEGTTSGRPSTKPVKPTPKTSNKPTDATTASPTDDSSAPPTPPRSTPRPTTKTDTNVKPGETKDPLGSVKPKVPKNSAADSEDKPKDEDNGSGSEGKNSSSTVTYSIVLLVLSSIISIIF
ncbi:hypothetical protein PPL_04360 [Heterostelium album PN500]|uniref:Uncharacterized protein n=1 Tax=Heterostelium pallidum (strain ATCC 26659 / Pp 5 / PN500) TaxID=670386 RepID=D3B7C3_HETP5|nr:hypothetical protein PPL_04360 [Heterostelium album PN500]EFA82666.1 hypothetical protein PPL_04360 [Heterostelium album PN500]|eukprot:XP_020434783.1 hypothetical protein PPL_04360 [Heterostelium album PN500]